ncbi:MAG: hypothetical protein CL535_06785 [Ahrensia sp.]|nr:hypothetical protein [Ahrensia sp.]|tara:strand:- start:33355 stop:33693 length:339 start_codon:yes stop_codon:yes gene_type:complete
MNRHLIRIGALASAAMLAATQAHAVARIRADLNSCATVQQTIIRDGSAVVRYPSKNIANYFLYDRYESPQRNCPIGERHVAHTVPAKDNPRCVVYNCEKIKPIFPFGDRFND